MISGLLRPMQPSCPSQLTIHGLNYQQNEKKKKLYFSVAMLGSYSCSNPRTETPCNSGAQEGKATWTKTKRERGAESDPYQFIQTRGRRTMNSEPSQPATADTESGAQWTADCSGRGRAETYPIARRDFLAGEASWRLLLRRFGSPLLVLAIDSSWLAFFCCLFWGEAGVYVCVWAAGVCLACDSTGQLDTWD